MILRASSHPQRARLNGLGRVHRGSRRAFTLVEVILAIGIAIGVLVVTLVLYQQAANLRGQLIDEAEKISALRLIFDRVSGDLRTAFPQPQIGFSGTSDSMNFIVARAPELVPGAPDAMLGPASDLRRVSYMLTAAIQGTNFVVTGLDRTEEPVLPQPPLSKSSSSAASPAAEAPPAAPVVALAGPAAGAAAGSAPAMSAEPLADTVRFVRFRYWDGATWLESWDAPELPMAVEISLGLEPLPEGESADTYPYELFRRTVRLPGRTSADEDWWATL